MWASVQKWLKKDRSPAVHPYYGERLKVSKHAVTLTRTNRDDEAIPLSQVDYVTIYRFANDDGRDLCWVNLKSYAHAPLSTSTLAGNFHQLESLLLGWAGFDVAQYLAIKQSAQAHEELVLWKKAHQPDFVLSPSAQSSLDLLPHGLMIENTQQFIPWGSYKALALHPAIKVTSKLFPNPRFNAYQYTVNRPVIANGLQLKSLYTCCDAYDETPKLDLPVIEWTAEISLGVNRVQNFLAIKTHLDAYLGAEKQQTAIPLGTAGDHLEWSSTQHLVTFSLRAFYRDETKDWDNVAWLRISYQPNLDAYYSNEYQQHLALSPALQYLCLPFRLALHTDYRQVENAIYTPACFKTLLEATNSLIWRDDTNGLIGFANAEFARVYSMEEMISLQLAVQNFRGSEGRNALEVVGHGGTSHLGAVSNVAAFIANIKPITKLMQKEVTHFTYDEHY